MRYEFSGIGAESGVRVEGAVVAASLAKALEKCRQLGIAVEIEGFSITAVQSGEAIIPSGPSLTSEDRGADGNRIAMSSRPRDSWFHPWSLGCVAIVLLGAFLLTASPRWAPNRPDEVSGQSATVQEIARHEVSSFNRPANASPSSTTLPSRESTPEPRVPHRDEAKTQEVANATRNAWNVLYRADLKALPKLTGQKVDDQIAALRIVVDGYLIDQTNVDKALLSFIDRHVALATEAISINERWDEARARGLKALDQEGTQIDEFVAAIFPEDFARGASVGRKLAGHLDRTKLLEKIDAHFSPRYSKAYENWLDSVKEQKRLGEALSARYAADFPVVIVVK